MIRDNCLYELVSFAARPEVGAVGARLLYEDDTVQHAGVVVGLGGVAVMLWSVLTKKTADIIPMV